MATRFDPIDPIIRPSKEQIQCITIYSAFWDPKRLSVWDILCNKLLCVTENYTLYELTYFLKN
jgi:hypothetical protein